MSDTYSMVDASPNIDEAIEWQERIDRWPAIARYKAAMDRRVGTEAPVLDVGTGPGLDAARAGAIGLDLSMAMATRARSRAMPVPVIVGDAQQLPVADGSVKGVRADRVLQHLADPVSALREMHRVLRPGGSLVVADPDQDTLSISVPGAPERLTSAVRRLRRDVGYRNGRFASKVAGLLAGMGMTHVSVEASALVLTDPELAFGLPGWVEYWSERAGFTTEDDELWRSCVAASTDAGFVYSVTYLVTSAIKPSGGRS